MIPFEEALELALTTESSGSVESVPLKEACGRILAQDVISDMDMPPFDKSAVDGFACRMEDLGKNLKILETIAAGKMPVFRVEAGQCTRIMTGAPLPEGADCVVMVEDSALAGDQHVQFSIRNTAPNICYRGEDVKAGQVLIRAGSFIKAADIAVMASAGCHRPEVFQKTRVAVISTGDELVEPDQKPEASQIRNSNAWQLMAQCAQMGLDAQYLGIVSDEEQETLEIIRKACDLADVILLTGGVSMGDFDHVPAMMQKAGFDILFRKIAIQPGRPTVMARMGNKICFGLPGNPVSSFVLFELLVKPVLYRRMGHQYKADILRLEMGADYRRKRTDRMNVIPVRLENASQVIPVGYHGSAHIHAMTEARGLLVIPAGISEIRKGSPVDVRLL